MKIRFKVAKGRAIIEYKDDTATIDEVKELLERDEVISLSATKMTPSQYFKSLKGGANNG